MAAYYNEIDPQAAQWLRILIAAGHIAPGDVDERSIEDVTPDDLAHYTQCHFFAGVGVWSYALRRAGWPDDLPIWTGSCPCQPFSAAGKSGGFADERHLWPAFYWLIKQCRPASILGEQVASKATEPWFDLAQADLEALGYAFGCVPFPSASVGAPMLRDRAFWVADDSSTGLSERVSDTGIQRQAGRAQSGQAPDLHSDVRGMADSDGRQQSGISVVRGAERDRENPGRQKSLGQSEPPSDVRWVADAPDVGCDQGWSSIATEERDGASGDNTPSGLANGQVGRRGEKCTDASRKPVGDGSQRQPERLGTSSGNSGAGPTNGYWRDVDWLFCRDGKWRPVEPGTFPLANVAAERVGRMQPRLSGLGFSESDIKRILGRRNTTLADASRNRVTRLKGYGNAINAEAAQAFIESWLEI